MDEQTMNKLMEKTDEEKHFLKALGSMEIGEKVAKTLSYFKSKKIPFTSFDNGLLLKIEIADKQVNFNTSTGRWISSDKYNGYSIEELMGYIQFFTLQDGLKKQIDDAIETVEKIPKQRIIYKNSVVDSILFILLGFLCNAVSWRLSTQQFHELPIPVILLLITIIILAIKRTGYQKR